MDSVPRVEVRWRRTCDESIAEALVVSLEKEMLDILRDDISEVPLAERHDSVETLDSNRTDKPFSVGIQIRATRRELDALHASGFQNLGKPLGEQRIAVMNQIADTAEKPIDRVSEMASNLFGPADMRHASRGQLDDKHHPIAHDAESREHFDGEEVGGGHLAEVSLEKLLPPGLSLALRSRLQAGINENPSDSIAMSWPRLNNAPRIRV
jgi:hypothetical protein